MKITLEGKEYDLNVDEAVKMKLLTPLRRITTFNVGDVFVSDGHAQIVVVQPVWGTLTHNREKRMFGFVGNRGNFLPYSNHPDLISYDDVLEYINDHDLEFKGNISQVLFDALKKITGDAFCF